MKNQVENIFAFICVKCEEPGHLQRFSAPNNAAEIPINLTCDGIGCTGSVVTPSTVYYVCTSCDKCLICKPCFDAQFRKTAKSSPRPGPSLEEQNPSRKTKTTGGDGEEENEEEEDS